MDGKGLLQLNCAFLVIILIILATGYSEWSHQFDHRRIIRAICTSPYLEFRQLRGSERASFTATRVSDHPSNILDKGD